jgi:WD40 repeat protein
VDDRTLLIGDAGTVKMFDTESRTVTQSFRADAYTCLNAAMTPDRKAIVIAATDGTLRFFDVETGKLEREIRILDNPVGNAKVQLQFSGDGRFLLAGNPTGTVFVLRLR